MAQPVVRVARYPCIIPQIMMSGLDCGHYALFTSTWLLFSLLCHWCSEILPAGSPGFTSGLFFEDLVGSRKKAVLPMAQRSCPE